jgi:membrane protease subunit HflK
VALVVWLASGFYVVQQGERGVVLRFGKQHEITHAGLRWRLPYPIERVERVNVEKVSTVEIGYRNNPRSSGKAKEPKEALMLTEDENIVDVEFAVQYQIKDAAHYLFNLRDPEITIRQATESAVREVVGRSTMDFVLTEGRGVVDQSALELLQKILDRYESGIQILRIEMQRSQPPEEVKAAFDDAVKAREDEQRSKNEAEAYVNDIIPRARGNAARQLQEAEAYKARTVARAEGEARRFTLIANEYVKAPAVTRERLYIETMEEVFKNTTKVMIDQKGGNNLIYLPLDKLVGSHDAEAPAPVATAEPETAKPAPAARGRTDLRKRGTQP